jgi:hypothetical protein
MKKIIKFIAEDGKEFADAKQCADYERTALLRAKLENVIAKAINPKFVPTGETQDFLDCFSVVGQQDVTSVMNALISQAPAVAKLLSGVKQTRKPKKPGAQTPVELQPKTKRVKSNGTTTE